ncbi:MAG: helix-turn-helix domain-containing protein [Pseudonocardiaceae bacterium]
MRDLADEDARTLGRRLRQIRYSRRKSLRVIAELAGISPSYLSRIENGERALDRRSLIVALANALEVAPTELTEVTLPASGEPGTDLAQDAIRLALLAVGMGRPGGELLDTQTLTARVSDLLDAQQACQHDTVAAGLPGLIRDLHTSVAAGRYDGGLLELVTLLHVQGTEAWLRDVGAPLDLAWQAATLAQDAADRLGDPQTRGLAAFGTTHGLIAAGAFDLAAMHLNEATSDVRTATPDGQQLAGMLAFTSSLVAAAQRHDAEVSAPLELAADLAQRTGEGNAYWFGFGPTNVGVWRMVVALEAGDHAQAAAIAEQLDPQRIPSPQRRAAYWADYGRALARLRGRREDATRALRRAELISPARVHRHPFVRETLAELLSRARRDAAGRELRGIAFRAGLLN